MFSSTVRVTPDPKYSAEVVVLLTTLGAKRTEFNAGKRVRDLLEIKRVHHKIIDFNRDARGAGTGEAENQAIQKLMQQGKLQAGDNDDLILPQIFIDGYYLGDANELQGLEDDGLLEAILLRRACMKCNDQRRAPENQQCLSCWEKFEEVLPGMMTIEQTLQELAITQDDDYGDEYDEEYDDEGIEDNNTVKYTASVKTTQPSAATASFPSAGATPLLPSKVDIDETFRISEKGKEPLPFCVGEKVQYWSDTKKRWVEAMIEGKRDKEGHVVYDLNCKKGAAADKIRRPQ